MSFWGKKFGAGASPPNVTPRPTGSVIPPGVLPQGMAGRQQQAVDYYVQQLPAFGNPESPYGGWQPNTFNPTKMEEVLPLAYWQGNPRGGAGETATTGNCPECGSPNFFSRSSGAQFNEKTGQMAPPAPECFNCGYPRQQGTLGTATVTGAAQVARQAGGPAPPGSLAALGSSSL